MVGMDGLLMNGSLPVSKWCCLQAPANCSLTAAHFVEGESRQAKAGMFDLPCLICRLKQASLASLACVQGCSAGAVAACFDSYMLSVMQSINGHTARCRSGDTDCAVLEGCMQGVAGSRAQTQVETDHTVKTHARTKVNTWRVLYLWVARREQ
eukprot:1137150-Pelagomonas_calceolata.AAC.11